MKGYSLNTAEPVGNGDEKGEITMKGYKGFNPDWTCKLEVIDVEKRPLYKGKAHDNKWHIGSLVWTTNNKKNQQSWIVSISSSIGGWLMLHHRLLVDPETIGEFTGYIDRSGHKVFTGDIVSAFTYNKYGKQEYTGKIFWNKFRYAFCLMTEKGEIFQLNEIISMSIIGNIHDEEGAE